MTDIATPPQVPDRPDPSLVYKRRLGVVRLVRDLWYSKGLVWSLAERNLRARYKQALLGYAWALISPLALLVAMTLLFDRVADIDTNGAPLVLFNYVGLLPWTFFAASMNGAGQSIITNLPLINKIACPREVFPLSAIVVALLDTVLALGALAVLFAIEGQGLSWHVVYLPVIFLVQIVFVIGFCLAMSVLIVYFRDLRNALPLITQLGLFVTPTVWGLDVIPEGIRAWYCLYPLAPVINSYRRVLLFGEAPQWGYLGIGAIGAIVMFVGAYALFKRMEVTLADVA